MTRRAAGMVAMVLALWAGPVSAADGVSDSLSVARAASAQLHDNERIYRVLAVPESCWSTSQPEYLVDLALLEPGEIVSQLVALRSGNSWELRRERWMYVFAGTANPRAVILYPPVDIARAGKILDTLAPDLQTHEIPMTVDDQTAIERRASGETDSGSRSSARRYVVRTRIIRSPIDQYRAFFVRVVADSVAVQSVVSVFAD